MYPKKNNMHPYQFSKFELYLMNRLEKKFHQYDLFEFERWPRVYWGNREDSDLPPEFDKTESLDRFDPRYQIDYLGVYRYTPYTEGFVEMYADRIREAAERISKKLELPFELTHNLLVVIVLIHELGHWLTHWCIKYTSKELQQAFLELAEDKYITETMAQLAVVWSCKGLSNYNVNTLRQIMDFLADKQPEPYYQYKKLGKKESRFSSIQKRYIKLLDLINLDVDYLLLEKDSPDINRSLKNYQSTIFDIK